MQLQYVLLRLWKMLKHIIVIFVQVTIGLGCIPVPIYLRLRVAVLFAQNRRHFYVSLNVAGELLLQFLRSLYYYVLLSCFYPRKGLGLLVNNYLLTAVNDPSSRRNCRAVHCIVCSCMA